MKKGLSQEDLPFQTAMYHLVAERKGIKMVVDACTSLEEVREACRDVTPASLLARNCDPNILTCFNQLAREYFKNGHLRLGNPVATINIIHELEKHSVERAQIDSYC